MTDIPAPQGEWRDALDRWSEWDADEREVFEEQYQKALTVVRRQCEGDVADRRDDVERFTRAVIRGNINCPLDVTLEHAPEGAGGAMLRAIPRGEVTERLTPNRRAWVVVANERGGASRERWRWLEPASYVPASVGDPSGFEIIRADSEWY